MSFEQSLNETLQDIENTFPASNYQKLASMLKEYWENFHASGRSDYLLSAREFVKNRGLVDETVFIEQSILSLAYQRQMSSIANGKLVPGEESNNWIAKKAVIDVQEDYKIQAKLPNNLFIRELTWDGLYKIRENQDFINALVDLRITSQSKVKTEYRDAVIRYLGELEESYKSVAKKIWLRILIIGKRLLFT